MPTLHNLNMPDDLYKKVQELAEAENRTIDAQVITLLQSALSVETKQSQLQKREDVVKMLDDIGRRREQLPTDVEWLDSTALIREDRDR